MKIFKVTSNLNGNMIFEVKAENQADAQRQVDELLADTTVKEALEKYRGLNLETTIKEKKERER